MVFCPLSTQPVVWRNQFLIGAQITVYDAGTLTPRTAYGDGLYHSALAQPILSDGNGCIPTFWVQGNPYKVQILTPQGGMVRVVDNLAGDTSTTPGPPPPPPATGALVTGDCVWNYGTQIITGRVRCAGKTIGNTLSGATEFADPSCQNCFEWLWNADASLPVIGGRGASAAADWAANKAITLPDANGRSIMGIDGMGSLPSNRLNGALFLTGTAATLGSTGGEAAHILTGSELAAHTHTGTTSAAGSHQHTGTTANSAAASYNAVTDTQGLHGHGGVTAAGGSHGHTGVTDTQGVHSHGGATGTDSPDHVHGYTAPGGAIGVGPGNAPYSVAGPGAAANTGGASARHAHSISADGNHAHNLSINAVGDHAHGIYADGAHQHNVSVGLIAHAHTFVTDPGGVHQHTFTSDSTGGGVAHNTCGPFILMTLYMVL